MSRRTEPPRGWPPPQEAVLAGASVARRPLAETIADRYFASFPQDLERYGAEVARAWEVHDTLHLLNWAIGAVEGYVELDRQVTWLAQVLDARNFPLEHLAVNLELAGDVVMERLEGGADVAGRLRGAAQLVRRTAA